MSARFVHLLTSSVEWVALTYIMYILYIYTHTHGSFIVNEYISGLVCVIR